MLQKNDPLWSAIVRWVFGYIRFQLRCGQTLNEIEQHLKVAVDNGELYSFMRTFEDLRSERARTNGAENVTRN